MAKVFESSQAASIRAKTSSGNYITLNGITTAGTTPDNAVTQINKITGLVGITVVANDMMRVKTENAVEGGDDDD